LIGKRDFAGGRIGDDYPAWHLAQNVLQKNQSLICSIGIILSIKRT
jgi:hypothetical protein